LSKERLDVLLVKKGFFDSREKARGSIMAGIVYVNNEKADKAGTKYNYTDDIIVKGEVHPFVSRGGVKLQKAIQSFNINLDGKIALDVGSSTGGFTDCMLKSGASKVYAIDVGYGQLAWELRNDERVVCMERTNIRYVKPEDIGELASFASIDVSFISLKKVLPVVSKLLNNEGEIVCLVKPQFEAGREKVGKRGVVREKETHTEVLRDIMHYSQSIELGIKDLTYSPIKGPEGNIEFLLYISKTYSTITEHELDLLVENVVNESHSSMNA
jgi:23S rRNA (cytidine1920-2'-O)/16S rRNA (cytidine1409-2'-O)-methyltransferase